MTADLGERPADQAEALATERALCGEFGILMIADEVMAGFG